MNPDPTESKRSEPFRSPVQPLPFSFACRPVPERDMSASPSPRFLKFRSLADPDLEFRSASRSEPSLAARSRSPSLAFAWADFSFLSSTPGSWRSEKRNLDSYLPWAFPELDFLCGWQWKPPSALFWVPFLAFSWAPPAWPSSSELSDISSPPAESPSNSHLSPPRFSPLFSVSSCAPS